jgi:hypothetical protein
MATKRLAGKSVGKDPQNQEIEETEHPALIPKPGSASWVLYRLRTAERTRADPDTGEPIDGEVSGRAAVSWETCSYNVEGQVIVRWDLSRVKPTYQAICETWGSGTYRISWFSASGHTISPGLKLRIDDARWPPRPAYPNPPRVDSPSLVQPVAVAPEQSASMGDLLAEAAMKLAAQSSGAAGGLGALIPLLPIGFQILSQWQQQNRAEEAMRFERLRQEERMIFERARQQDEARLQADRQQHQLSLERIRLESAESMRAQQQFWSQQMRVMKEVNRDPQEDIWEEMREAIETLKDRDKGSFEKIAELAPTLMQFLPKPPTPAAPVQQ